MILKDVLTSKDPLKLACIILTNKEFEEAFQTMIFKNTGVDLKLNITTEHNFPYIMLNVPKWENKRLSPRELLVLEKNGFSFDFPDEDFTYLMERFFDTDEKEIHIEAKIFDKEDINNFTIEIYIQLDYYETLIAGLAE